MAWRETAFVYRRKNPTGIFAFMVANYSGLKRNFASYGTEIEVSEAATKLANRI